MSMTHITIGIPPTEREIYNSGCNKLNYMYKRCMGIHAYMVDYMRMAVIMLHQVQLHTYIYTNQIIEINPKMKRKEKKQIIEK